MRDFDLYKQIRMFCDNGVELIAKTIVATGSRVPTRVAENFIVVDDHTVSQKKTVEVDWSMLVIKEEKELKKLISYQNAVKLLETHVVIGPQMNTLIGSSGFMRRMDASELLRVVLTSVLMEKNEALLDENLFNTLYKKIENFLFADIFHYKYFAPISNFSMDADELRISDDLRIAKITKEDKERLMSSSDAFYSTYSALAFKEYAFEFLIDQKKIIGEKAINLTNQELPSEVARAMFDKVCSALRLYKEGLVGINQIWGMNQDWDFFGNSCYFTHKGPAEFYGNKMMLSNQEVPEFLELFKKYKDISAKNRKKIINAVNRLSFGTERLRPEDQITDYFIGLEGLFLSDNNPELKYRLALSVAHWLGKNLEDKKKIFNIISMGYVQRSSIVHGGDAKHNMRIGGTLTTIVDHTKLVENYLRHATKKFVAECSDKDKSEDQLLIELRDKILD